MMIIISDWKILFVVVAIISFSMGFLLYIKDKEFKNFDPIAFGIFLLALYFLLLILE